MAGFSNHFQVSLFIYHWQIPPVTSLTAILRGVRKSGGRETGVEEGERGGAGGKREEGERVRRGEGREGSVR